MKTFTRCLGGYNYVVPYYSITVRAAVGYAYHCGGPVRFDSEVSGMAKYSYRLAYLRVVRR